MIRRPTERELSIEQAASSHRDRDATGRILPSAAWLDLALADREEAYEYQSVSRVIESLVAPDGLTTTGREIVARAHRLAQAAPEEHD